MVLVQVTTYTSAHVVLVVGYEGQNNTDDRCRVCEVLHDAYGICKLFQSSLNVLDWRGLLRRPTRLSDSPVQ
jgi:hypothetical protein